MGRTTPSLRVIIREYIDRLKKTSEILPDNEQELIREYLEDIESTMSLAMHAGVVDPVEVLLLHLLRRLGEICRCREE